MLLMLPVAVIRIPAVVTLDSLSLSRCAVPMPTGSHAHSRVRCRRAHCAGPAASAYRFLLCSLAERVSPARPSRGAVPRPRGARLRPTPSRFVPGRRQRLGNTRLILFSFCDAGGGPQARQEGSDPLADRCRAARQHGHPQQRRDHWQQNPASAEGCWCVRSRLALWIVRARCLRVRALS